MLSSSGVRYLPALALALALAMVLVFAALAPAFAQSPGLGARRALLIGINTYAAVPALSGSLNDVAAMREVLITRWGFEARNIHTLTERAATRAGILAALEQLVREAAPSDVVYLHYSGHGSQVQDLNGDEDDGLDETLVPQDGRQADVADITDDELDLVFSKLRAAATLIVLDSCHSGTATRALEVRTRAVPRDARIELYRAGTTSTRAIVPRVQARYVVMSGAAANQEALDGPVDGQSRGFFSYALSRSLASAGSNASPRAVFAGVEQELRRIQAQFGRSSMPEPQLEGPPTALDRAVFAAAGASAARLDTAPRLAWVEASAAGAGKVILRNGVLLGAAAGSTWAVYAPGETRFAPGGALAVARVVPGGAALRPGDAQATVQPANVQIPAGARAVLLSPAPGAQQVSLRIVDLAGPAKADLEALLRRTLGEVRIVGVSEPARFQVNLRGEQLRIMSADGLQEVATFDTRSERWGAALNQVIARSVNAAELLSLDNPSSRLKVNAQVIGREPASRDIVLAETRPAQLRVRRADQPRDAQNSLQLAITVNSDAYLTIVDVDSEGRANLLFPNPAQRADFLPDGRVSSHVPVLLPDSLASGNRAGFFWDYGPPAGLDTIRIFASTDLATAHMIRERVRSMQGGVAGPVSRGLDSLRLDLNGLATRGISTVADSSNAAAVQSAAQESDWATATVTAFVTQ